MERFRSCYMAAALSCQGQQANHTASCHILSGLVGVHRSQLPGSGCRTLVSLYVVRRPAQANVASEDILLGASSMKYL
jgi:hypothetical protein